MKVAKNCLLKSICGAWKKYGNCKVAFMKRSHKNEEQNTLKKENYQ